MTFDEQIDEEKPMLEYYLMPLEIGYLFKVLLMSVNSEYSSNNT
jgi:hypothetical protein